MLSVRLEGNFRTGWMQNWPILLPNLDGELHAMELCQHKDKYKNKYKDKYKDKCKDKYKDKCKDKYKHIHSSFSRWTDGGGNNLTWTNFKVVNILLLFAVIW